MAADVTSQDTVLANLGYDPFFSSQLHGLDKPELSPARIASDGRDCYWLRGCRASLGELSGRLRHSLGPLERPVTGDWVAVADRDERAVIHHVLARRTAMLRRGAGAAASGQVVAANVDLFFVVTSANRDFNERRLERYLTAVWDSGGTPVVVLNKIDLGGDIEAMVQAIQALAFGVAVVRVSAKTGEGAQALHAHIRHGTTTAFVGSSGVGKSSLVNRLVGHDLQQVREVRQDERGRHATTRRELIELSGGGVLIDTPGMRELGLVENAGGVETAFADVEALAKACRFRDCQHEGEPGCAVAAAVEEGRLEAPRLASYHKLQREIAVALQRQDPIHAGRPKRRWRWIAMASRERAKLEPK